MRLDPYFAPIGVPSDSQVEAPEMTPIPPPPSELLVIVAVNSGCPASVMDDVKLPPVPESGSHDAHAVVVTADAEGAIARLSVAATRTTARVRPDFR
ncbi:hypothetical protein GCM10007269_09510 [Microbacterium murale]|uniref:Uncharacterized protein n=1 Tax=Microbacterium murale TaxID=1081040 RepID=A0ABQ1RFA4_9MICO|nr:hypothetical protein GCM10007269_09510 [Microbacterium murale]